MTKVKLYLDIQFENTRHLPWVKQKIESFEGTVDWALLEQSLKAASHSRPLYVFMYVILYGKRIFAELINLQCGHPGLESSLVLGFSSQRQS